MLTHGGAHACKTYRLVVVLLLCAIPATMQYCRQVRRQTPARTVQPHRVIYELLGDVTHPGIYRFEEEQTPAAWRLPAELITRRIYDTDKTITTGTRLVFNEYRNRYQPHGCSSAAVISPADIAGNGIRRRPGTDTGHRTKNRPRAD